MLHLSDLLPRVHAGFDAEDVEEIECWSIKEGHTASVWAITFRSARQESVRVALNVARDAAAGEELEGTAAILRALESRLSSIGLARVLAAEPVVLSEEGRLSVPVLAQEWIEETSELGLIRDATTGTQSLVAIDRFLTDPVVAGHVRSVLGRRIIGRDQPRVLRDIISASLEGAAFDFEHDRVSIPRFEINEGDFVIGEGSLSIVAVCAETVELTPAEARRYFLERLPEQYGVTDDGLRRAFMRNAAEVVASVYAPHLRSRERATGDGLGGREAANARI